MGKPYDSELLQLPVVYRWAVEQEIDLLSSTIAMLGAYNLQVIGSGGSLTLAYLMSYLHQRFFRRLARPLTPLNAIQTPTLKSTAVFLLTAGGKHPDVIQTFQHFVQEEPTALGILCNSNGSPLAQVANEYEYVRIHEFEPPTRKDGFVATNTLLATAVLLSRAYTKLFPTSPQLPSDLQTLFGGPTGYLEFFTTMEQEAAESLRNDFFLVLYGSCTEPAAWDIESKFSEAALGAVQLADYRNFAHGRHHWIDRYGVRTSVVALMSSKDEEIAERTLQLLPQNIPKIRIHLRNSEALAAISALIAALYLVKFAGHAKNIDPGRPKVPDFGRRLYNMSNLRSVAGTNLRDARMSPIAAAAITRKSRTSLEELSETDFTYWVSAYNNFLEALSAARFQTVIFDYDGTLCESGRRFKGVGDQVADHCSRLLQAKILLGIATGRGKSVKEDFRRTIEPRHWTSVFIGYYNCGQIGQLDEDTKPDLSLPYLSELSELFDLLSTDPQLKQRVTSIELRPQQISIVPRPWDVDNICNLLIDSAYAKNLKVVRSTHSIDVLPVTVSKNSIVSHIRDIRHDIVTPVLRVGDLGTWPGNDFEFLADPYGISVHETSSDPRSCWNLSKPGHRGVQATLDYLNALVVSDNGIYFDLETLGIERIL